jgi:quinol-cytochrome oxidoreductase complex cytochrome b subunit
MFLPHLLVREIAQALMLIAAVVLLAVAAGAPLGDPANPGMSPNPVTAPWYFVGFQELLIHLHPVFAILLIPAAGAIGAALLRGSPAATHHRAPGSAPPPVAGRPSPLPASP